MRKLCALQMVVAAGIFLVASVAQAFPQFWKEFDGYYLKEHENTEWADQVRDKEAKVNCLICHQGKKKKKNRNAYGDALDELLTKKDKKDSEKIIAAFQEVADLPVDPDDEDSETFGDRIAAGKWPAGELDDLMEEPASGDE